jgi:arsenate reductase (thioredoxin)
MKRVLFLCVKNSSRSQMAEALLRMAAGVDFEVHSAGIRPAKEINPHAVSVMRELGYDMGAHRAKHASDLRHITFDFVAKMDVPEPEIADQIKAKWIETWDIPDPANGGVEEYRKVRDLLRERISRVFRQPAA